MNKDLAHITVIVDRSGSMQSIARDMEGGIKNFIEDQKKADGKCTISFIRFDSEYEKVLDFVDINTVGDLKLEPRGMTALNDAVGKAIIETGETLRNMKEEDRPALVTVFIVTDGGENASREFSSEAVNKLVKEQESKYGWVFNYLGANQDAIAVAQGLGISGANSSNYTSANSRKAFTNYSGKLLRARNMVSCDSYDSAALEYSQEDMDDLNGNN